MEVNECLRSPRSTSKLPPMPKVSPRSHALVALLLGILVVAGYASIVGLGFLSDDYALIRLTTLPDLTTVNWSTLFGSFYSPMLERLPFYRPFYSLSFGADYALFGTDPLGYHLTNLILHLAASFFVYLVALELVPGGRRWGVAITAGALFALYPVHPEVVTWIAGRVDSICAVFYFPALYFFLRWLRSERKLYPILSLAAFVLALMSKEMAVTLPGILLLCALYKRRSLTDSIFRIVPFAVTLGIYIVVRAYLLSGLPAYAVVGHKLQPGMTLTGFLFRTLHMFIPVNYELLPGGWQSFIVSLTFVWPLVAIVALIVVYFRNPVAGRFSFLLLVLYSVSLVPLVKVLRPDPALVSSRWSYIPSAFLAILIAYAVWALFGGRLRWAAFASVVVCAVFLAVLVANNGPWLRAGEIADQHLKTGKAPEMNLKYKGAQVFSSRITWLSANLPPFKER